MSDLREAAQMALDALDIYREHNEENIGLADAAYEALRQALAQPKWVELTEDEYLDILNSSDGVYEYLTKLEAKLKEKNT